MNLHEKLFEIQKAVSTIVKDGENKSDKYDYVSGGAVLSIVRPKMDELKLLLIPTVTGAELHEGTTRSGTARFLTEINYTFTWHDVESGEELSVPWYAQGADLAGERGVGKAATYAEKTFLLKFFHIPTDKDDPDSDKRTGTGEKATRGTAAAAETAQYHRKAIMQMLNELYSRDAEKVKAGLVAMTRSDKRGYAGTGDISQVSTAALPVVYAKIKKQYESRVGHAFELKEDEDNADA